MKGILLTSVVVCGAVFVAYHFRDDPRIAIPVESFMGQSRQAVDWPPRLNEPYPDLELLDQNGVPTRLRDFRGKIVLVEPIGMSCPACQAFCGGHQVGGFRGIKPQAGLPSIKEAARTHGRFDLSDDRIVKVYLLLYGMDMQAPSPRDAKAWADHFGLDRSKNEIVLAGLSTMISDQSYAMIPGLQLIDQDFILRVDCTGDPGRGNNLYRDLLPRVPGMLSRGADARRKLSLREGQQRN
jgi:hypothetical protein